MSGIPRTRSRGEKNQTAGNSPTAGYYRLPLGKFSLEVTPGVRTPIPGFNPIYTDVSLSTQKSQTTRDYIHKGPPYLEGDDFASRCVEFPDPRVIASGHYHSFDHTETFYGIGTGRVHYEGGFLPFHWGNGFDWKSWLAPSFPQLSTASWEQQAYSKTRPKVERASAFVFLAETRDIPRMLRSTSKAFHDVWLDVYESNIPFRNRRTMHIMRPKRVADDFLNHQFGWVPFIGDLRKFSQTFDDFHAIKAKLISNNDKWIRRRVVLDDSWTEREVSRGTGMGVEPLGYLVQALFVPGSSPTWSLVERKHNYVTAVGSYKYYRPEFDRTLPDFDSAWNTVNRYLTIYGVRVTPSTIYRATPWTWLADWMTDFGTNIDAFTDIAVDAVAARYLYVSSHTETEQILTQTLPFRSGTISASWSLKWTEKVRNGANTPYGFGLSWNLLSPRQLAILASLGITRMR